MRKELLTLEKDKKDQSKYYLRYPKPPVLDMKWGNCDFNVVEWAFITTFPLLLRGDWEKNVFCGWWNAYLQLLVLIYLWITISHFFICLPSRKNAQQKYVTQMNYHSRQTAAKKWNVATLNNVDQAKRECNSIVVG